MCKKERVAEARLDIQCREVPVMDCLHDRPRARDDGCPAFRSELIVCYSLVGDVSLWCAVDPIGADCILFLSVKGPSFIRLNSLGKRVKVNPRYYNMQRIRLNILRVWQEIVSQGQ